MRKFVLLAVLAVSASSMAQVIAIPGPFPTPVQLQEDFDSIIAGSYAGQNIFTTPMFGTVFALNSPNLLDIAPPPWWQPPAFSAPNTCVGNGTDIGIRVSPVMRRFGGWFRNSPNTAGVAPTFAKVVFYGGGAIIGSAGIPLTNTWTWFGWKVNPKFSGVAIYGSAGPGGVEIDDIEVRPV